MLDDLSAAHERVDDWESALRERVTRARELTTRTAALVASATDPDGLVKLTIDSTGALIQLWLSERNRHHAAELTAQLILTTMRAAQVQLAQRITAEAVAAYAPESPAALAIIASVERRFGTGSAGNDAAR